VKQSRKVAIARDECLVVSCLQLSLFCILVECDAYCSTSLRLDAKIQMINTVDMLRQCATISTAVAKRLQDAVVYIDDGAAEAAMASFGTKLQQGW
jgi:hypothetical protein